MNIWLIMSGEPLEQFGNRPHRVGILSKMLRSRGNIVNWWTTTYDHQGKKYLYSQNTENVNRNDVSMIFLHSKNKYRKNISYLRIKNHVEVSKEFNSLSSYKKKPDIIYCAFPTIDLAYEAVKYGKSNDVPIVIDVRDLWPDIFINPFHRFLHPLIKFFLKKYIKQTKYVFKNCTAITAVSKKYLDYGLHYGHRSQSVLDRVFPLAYQEYFLEQDEFQKCYLKFSKMGVDTNKIIVWFVGTFGSTYDLLSVIKAVKRVDINVQFVMTGDGENDSLWKKESSNNPNIIFTGWANKEELCYLGNVSKIGLMAYRKGAPQGLPNKIFEYMSYGLPILSSLEGESKILLNDNNVGLTYKASDSKDFMLNLMILVNDKERLKNMSDSCRLLYKNKYSSDKVYSDLVHYLESFS
jgi:glycosyltransferase involved in cell wall biosynthesis